MLKDYSGPSNSPEIFKHLVGETIRGAFVGDDGHVYLVLSDVDALVFAGGAYWKEGRKDVEFLVGKRRAQIERQLAELGRLTALEGSCPTDG